jgi:DNA polymerase
MSNLQLETREERFAQLHEIEAQVRACTLCRLYKGTTNGVPGVGNYEAIVMFVGEGPGAEEDRQGKPFVGRSGQFLTSTLASLGIARDEVFITNVVKHRPPENRDPLPDEVAACSTYLTRQIALISPRIIVTLGRFSMQRWFPGEGITKVHGKVRNIGQGRVALAMFHPAAALRNPAWKVDFERDLAQLPDLIARAKRKNEAAARGEALPAGVPHPGDADYRSDPTHGDLSAKHDTSRDESPKPSKPKQHYTGTDTGQLTLFGEEQE